MNPASAPPERLDVLLVTAAMGAGHTDVADELARRLGASGLSTAVVDLLQIAPDAGERLRRTYRRILDHAPWVYEAAMRFWQRWPAPLEWFTAANDRAFDDALQGVLDRHTPRVVVSTYNLGSQCLGRMAGRGRVGARVVTVVVDPGPHRYWISPHVAHHWVPTELTGQALRGWGAAGVAVVPPVLRPEFADPPPKAQARRELGLPAEGTLAVLSAGSWGVGGIEQTVATLQQLPGVAPLVLCGRNEAALAGLTARGVRAVGWTDRMAAYLSAADVVVDNAGGQTSREAFACRTPVVLYRPLPGHGRLNAAALERLGSATWARTRAELAAALAEPSALPHSGFPPVAGADAAERLLDLVSRARSSG